MNARAQTAKPFELSRKWSIDMIRARIACGVSMEKSVELHISVEHGHSLGALGVANRVVAGAPDDFR